MKLKKAFESMFTVTFWLRFAVTNYFLSRNYRVLPRAFRVVPILELAQVRTCATINKEESYG